VLLKSWHACFDQKGNSFFFLVDAVLSNNCTFVKSDFKYNYPFATPVLTYDHVELSIDPCTMHGP
jgi:hypothetical protein